jgi:glycosyltransferase involved in cell wall biosynthesis
MRDRITTVFSDLPNIESKFVELHLGVDTSQFEPVPSDRREQNIASLEEALAGFPRAAAGEYESKLPDAGVETKLRQVNWREDPVVLFTGRLIPAKGIQHVVEAMPRILEKVPNVHLIIVGHGPLRAPLESRIRELGIAPDKIIFTGYLTHRELHLLFPCCDVGVFPSMVREAGPLVFLESLASGCFPLGTYFGGMAASIDAVSRDLPAEVGSTMKLGVDNTTQDLISQIPRAIAIGQKYKNDLARIARERYDWVSVARTFHDELASIAVHRQ